MLLILKSPLNLIKTHFERYVAHSGACTRPLFAVEFSIGAPHQPFNGVDGSRFLLLRSNASCNGQPSWFIVLNVPRTLASGPIPVDLIPKMVLEIRLNFVAFIFTKQKDYRA